MDLEVVLHFALNFNEHIRHSLFKAHRINAAILKFFSFSSAATKIKLFNCYIRPHLEYASQVWNPDKMGSHENWECTVQIFQEDIN